MLDVLTFIKEKGGDPEVIRESQRRRGHRVEAVDEIIDLYTSWTKRERTSSTSRESLTA